MLPEIAAAKPNWSYCAPSEAVSLACCPGLWGMAALAPSVLRTAACNPNGARVRLWRAPAAGFAGVRPRSRGVAAGATAGNMDMIADVLASANQSASQRDPCRGIVTQDSRPTRIHTPV